jgi:hypothetical protein
MLKRIEPLLPDESMTKTLLKRRNDPKKDDALPTTAPRIANIVMNFGR